MRRRGEASGGGGRFEQEPEIENAGDLSMWESGEVEEGLGEGVLWS